jgi:hypothetical protein
MPADGCILLSVHQFNQRVGFARLSMAVHELGAVSMFELRMEGEPDPPTIERVPDTEPRDRARSRFARWVFGERIYSPPFAARGGLELLRRGGSLIVLSDFLGRDLACVLGRQIPVPNGAVWLAQRSGRAIVPFVLSPQTRRPQFWQLWCGEPIAPTRPALIAALEECIRRSPTSWTGWPAWYEAPASQ